MHLRVSPAAVFATLPLLVVAACGAPAPAAASRPAQAAAPSAAAAASSDPLAAYCAANADLSEKTRALAGQSTISDADYAATADAFEQLGAIAPADVTKDLATLASSYRAIAEGRSDIQKEGSDVAAATLRLADANRRHCLPPGASGDK
jgi:hypothetical protein